eukprot:11069569-Karenia_brevis.AAC.1
MEPYFLSICWNLPQFAGAAGGQAVDIVLILRLLSINHTRWPLPDYVIVKLDLFRAFDRVHISKVIDMLEALEIPKWLSFAYVQTLVGSSLVPIFDGREAPQVKCHRGFATHSLLQSWQSRGLGVSLAGMWLGLLGYADDLVIIASSWAQADTMIKELASALEGTGLEISTQDNKCTCMQLKLQDEERTEEIAIAIGGRSMKR